MSFLLAIVTIAVACAPHVSAFSPLPLTEAQMAVNAAGFFNGVNFGGHFLMETSWMFDEVSAPYISFRAKNVSALRFSSMFAHVRLSFFFEFSVCVCPFAERVDRSEKKLFVLLSAA